MCAASDVSSKRFWHSRRLVLRSRQRLDMYGCPYSSRSAPYDSTADDLPSPGRHPGAARAVRLAVLAVMCHLDLACDYDFPPRSQLRAAVCLVGQIGRIEVPSKVRNLLKPNAGLGALDVFLVMEEGETRYTNAENMECPVAPKTLVELEKALSAHVRVTTVPRKRRIFDHVKPTQWQSYQGGLPEIRDRVNNHLNQYASWHQCMEAIENREAENGQQRYHVVLRLRDTSMVLAKYDLHVAFLLSGYRHNSASRYTQSKARAMVQDRLASGKCMDPPVVTTKDCASWGGYPDKVMLIPRRYASDALSGPLMDHPQLQEQNSKRRLSGPEEYLQQVLWQRHVPVRQRGPDFMPVTDGRCEMGKYFCVTKHPKDCKPPGLTQRWPICTFTYTRARAAYEKRKMKELGLVG